MNGNFIRVRVIALAVSFLMAGMVYADAYDQSTPSLPPITGPDGSKIIPPAPPPPPPAPSMQTDDNMQQSDMNQGMDSNVQMPQNGDMNTPSSPGGMRTPPPGMSGGRSNAPMPPSGAGPQSKRAPIVKSKAKVSKR